MSGWETTISTGSPDHDRMMIEQYRGQARASGMDLQVNPLPSGGFHVRAVPMQQQQYAYRAPPASNQPAYAGAAVAAAAQPGAAQGAITSERLAYLRKVYGLLGSAVLIAIFAGYALLELLPKEAIKIQGKKFMLSMAVVEMLQNPVLMWGAFGLLFAMTFVASWTSKVPVVNVVMLYLVSLLMGIELAPMIMVAQVSSGLGGTISTEPVRDAFMMTGAVFAGVTGYVFVSKKDFSYLGALVSIGMMVVFVGCILTLVLGSEIFTLAVCSVGALVASLFLMWQTWWVLKGDMDDPVGDALVFLVQLRNLFMFLLRIFMSRD
jgi:modulator of FtsH protease